MEKQGQPGLLWNSHPQASGVWQACKTIKKKELKERRTGRKRVNLSRGGMRKREKSKGKINTRVLPVIFLLGDRINILLS